MRRLAAMALGSTIAAAAAAAFAQPAESPAPTDAEVFAQGVADLRLGAHDKALASFEALADRGVAHPDAAYDRGLAYLGRVRARDERPGDLGRAAAAFEECLALRPDDTDAERALDLVRAEVSRREMHRGGRASVQARPSLDRAVVGLAPESVWAGCALAGSLLLAAGLVLRRFGLPALHIAGVIATPIGLVALLTFAPVAWVARHLRNSTRAAVVVVPEARLLDERGIPVGADPIPEAARVETGERRGALVHVRYGSSEAWTHAASLRLVSGPP